MAQPTELILKDIRCIEGEQRGRIRPITLLVGENSTGKSTFLACFSVIHRMLSAFDRGLDDIPDFNREPFSMGSFRDIVRSRRGPSGRINEFQLGLKFPQQQTAGMPTEIQVTFGEQGSQPMQRSLLYRFGSADFVELRQKSEGKTIVSIPNKEAEIDFPSHLWGFGLDFLVRRERFEAHSSGAPEVIHYVRKLLKLDEASRRSVAFRNLLNSSLVPIAPLRAKPKRTYDPVGEIDSPEGEHIPMLMMRLNHGDGGKWRSLHDALVDFVKESGLFADIKVRRHGKNISDPFQLQVKVQSGSHANIMDVGYGVSQSLPILVSLLSGDEAGNSGRRYRYAATRTFLLQQPEVHLHPKGQAELAELFARIVTKRKRRDNFLIETHSDYIVDRMRILVRKELLRPDDVSIIFFEPLHNAVKLQNIALDEYGNIKNAPAGYRSFFLKETDQLLGFAD